MGLRCLVQRLCDIVLYIMVQTVEEIGGREGGEPLFVDGAVDGDSDGGPFVGKKVDAGAEVLTAIVISPISVLLGIPIERRGGIRP